METEENFETFWDCGVYCDGQEDIQVQKDYFQDKETIDCYDYSDSIRFKDDMVSPGEVIVATVLLYLLGSGVFCLCSLICVIEIDDLLNNSYIECFPCGKCYKSKSNETQTQVVSVAPPSAPPVEKTDFDSVYSV